MKKFIIVALALALTGGIAYANYCARDYVPAATLLVPFGMVELDDNYAPDYSGYTTMLTVTNVSSERVLIHITVWDVLSTHVVDFDEVLSGYDIWSINFRDLLEGHFERFDTAVERVGGVITKTPDYEGFWGPQNRALPYPQYDYGETLGPIPYPWGPTSNCTVGLELLQPEDIDYAGAAVSPQGLFFSPTQCFFPYGYLPTVGAVVLETLVGEASFAATLPQYACTRRSTSAVSNPDWIKNFDDTQAWFYVTVDVVNFCSQLFPDSDDYWTYSYFGWHINRDVDVLIGDVIYVDTTHNYSESVPAVSVEVADWPIGPARDYLHIWDELWWAPFAGPSYTFYGDYMPIGDEDFWYDGREPLPTAWAFRYLNTLGIVSYLRVWKSWSDLSWYYSSGWRYYMAASGSYVYYAWDENENTKVRGGGPSGFLTLEPNSLPWEVQEVPLTNGNFTALMPGNGWMLLVFDPSVWNSMDSIEVWFSSGGPAYYFYPAIQSWVGVKYVFGSFSTMLEAAVMANYWCYWDQTILDPNGDLKDRILNINWYE